MHELFSKVLSERDLSHAGDLFSVHDKDIVDDLSEVLNHIGVIVGAEDYLSNNNDQSVVEISITRVTTAIRETGSIEKHAQALVSLWELCLQHNLKPLIKDEDPPHAKIASDIMSCLFMNYSKRSVMELAMPVAVKFLHQGNKELARNMSSYLSLVAIENSSLLALHTNTIIHSILEGNHSLTRVLLQIYRAEEPEPINQHISELLQLLPACDNSEKTNTLQLVGLIAKHDPQLLSPYMEELVEYLHNPSTAQVVLATLVDMSSTHAENLVSTLPTLVEAIEKQPSLLNMAAKVLSAVGKLKKVYARKCVGYLMSQLSSVDQTTLPSVLIEVKSVTDNYPGVLVPHYDLISQHEKSSSTAVKMLVEQLKEDVTKGTATLKTVQVNGHGDKEATDNQTEDASDDELPLFFVNPKQTSIIRDKEVPNEPTLTVSELPNNDAPNSVDAKKTLNGKDSAIATVSLDGSADIISVEKTSVMESQSQSAEAESLNSSQENNSPATATGPMQPTLAAAKKSQSLPRRLDKGHLARDERSSTRSEKLSARSGYKGGVQRASLRMDGRFGLRSGIGDPINGRSSSGSRDSSIQQYLAQRHKEITTYVESITSTLPIPNKCHVQETKSHPRAKLEFFCAKKSDNCVFDKMPFHLVSRRLEPWIHLMFLHLQTSSSTPIALSDSAVQDLKASWEKQHTKGVPSTSTFTRTITQGFPNLKVQSQLIDELRNASYFDVFAFNEKAQGWFCFLCNNPDQASDMQSGGQPMIEGCLKEKKVRWKLFRRWKTRYFTLAGERLVSSKSKSSTPSLPIELRKIHSVKTLSKRDSRRMPRAFEIFTDDKTYVLKTKDGPAAQQWVQCLTLAIRQAGCGSRQPIHT